MPKKIYKKTAEGNYSNKTYSPLGVIPTETEWNKVVRTDTAQTITGAKTFNAPANKNGVEQATATFKTSNGGQLIVGKEGPNSGTRLRFDQTAGTTRLQFRASATPGAMVWSQPEKGATLFFDLTDSAGSSTRTTLDAKNGALARTSDIGNGKITIQKNGTDVGSFTVNQGNAKTINRTLSKSDVGLGNVDNTADSAKSVKYAAGSSYATNARNLISSDEKIKYTVDTITDLQIAVKRKMESEYYDFSYGIFFRDLDGKQYHGIKYNNRRMIVAFDNRTDPTNSSDDIGYKMVDLCTVMSSGINANDEKDYGGAIFANAISPNQSTGDNADLLLSASQEAAVKFKEAHGSAVNGGFGCLDGTARGSLFKSRINSDSGKIYTSALMFRHNLESNDADLMASQSTANSLMPCFSIYNGIQVTTSGTIYNKNDTIDVLKDRNEQNAAFLAYSKTGKNVDMDRIVSSLSGASKKPTIGKSEVITVTIGTVKKITHTANQDIIYEGYITYEGNGNYPVDISLQRTSDTETSVISQWSSEQGSTECTVDVHYHRVTY